MKNSLQTLDQAITLEDLNGWLVSQQMVQKVIDQIEKDFAQHDLPIEVEGGRIIETIQQHIERLLHADYQKLQNLLYRIDIDERKQTQLQTMHQNMPERDVISFLIIQREAQKVFFKEYYKNL